MLKRILHTVLYLLCLVMGWTTLVQAQQDSTLAVSAIDKVNEMNFTALFFKTIFSLILVILLLVAFVYGLKWLQKRMQGGYYPQQNMTVIESLALGPKKQLHLVKLLDRVLLISSSEEQINFLLELDKEETQHMAEQKKQSKTFSKTLSEQLAKFGTTQNKHGKTN